MDEILLLAVLSSCELTYSFFLGDDMFVLVCLAALLAVKIVLFLLWVLCVVCFCLFLFFSLCFFYCSLWFVYLLSLIHI